MMRSRSLALAAAVLLVACTRPATEKQAPVSLSGEDVAARLAAADAADGQADRVVAKCAVCRLGMDGDPANASTHSAYALHFCSADCKQTFDKDPLKVIAKLPAAPVV